jgi:transcriptional regulator with XRE-family HTH domain
MNTNPMCIAPEPLNVLLRRRRLELGLLQAEVAEELHVSAEAVTMWESGRRRMDLCKIPRIATALQLDPKELCTKALFQFHPSFSATLFGDCGVEQTNPQEVRA